jgi:hypothetical protein
MSKLSPRRLHIVAKVMKNAALPNFDTPLLLVPDDYLLPVVEVAHYCLQERTESVGGTPPRVGGGSGVSAAAPAANAAFARSSVSPGPPGVKVCVPCKCFAF